MGSTRRRARVRLEKEPQGRLRWLTKEEASRLLGACDASKNLLLGAIVRLALGTGMRREEILGLTWERVDFARGVLRLEVTKSGRRREIPMDDRYAHLAPENLRQAVNKAGGVLAEVLRGETADAVVDRVGVQHKISTRC